MFATSFVQNIFQLAVTRIFMGMASGVTPATLGLLGAVVPRDRIPFAVGLAQGTSSLGFTLGPLLGGMAVVWLGYRLGFAVAGTLIGTAGLIIWFGVPTPGRLSFPARRGRSSLFSELRDLLRIQGMWAALGLVGTAQLAPNLVFPSTAFYVRSLGTDVSPGTIGLYFTLSGLCVTGAAWAMGALSSKLSLRTLLLGGCAMMGAGAGALTIAGSVPSALVWGGVTGVGTGVLTAGAAAWMGTVAPHERSGAAFGMVQSANALGFGLGPLVGGVIANAFGLRAPFAAEAVLAVLLGAFVLSLRRWMPRD
jgi:DHA1 family multidrug resistance protein-like MFS transporter